MGQGAEILHQVHWYSTHGEGKFTQTGTNEANRQAQMKPTILCTKQVREANLDYCDNTPWLSVIHTRLEAWEARYADIVMAALRQALFSTGRMSLKLCPVCRNVCRRIRPINR